MTTQEEQSGILDRVERFGRFVENASLIIVLTAMVVLAAAQIVMRNLLDAGLPWGDEALRLMVLWVAMLGGVAASRDRRHIVIDALARLLKGAARRWVAFCIDVLSAGVAGILAWHSLIFVRDSQAFGDLLMNDLPAWPFQSILPVGFALIAWRYAVWCVRHVVDALRKEQRQ